MDWINRWILPLGLAALASQYAVHHGCGWRADCLGDMGGFSKSWSHM
jgi:hypothetical protein